MMYPLYDLARCGLLVFPAVFSPAQFFINAPFGRFTPSNDSILLLDGVHSWILMELAAPVAFIYAFVNTPLADSPTDVAPLTPSSLFFAGLFLVHYANRALISPLRSPSRSKAHFSVALSGIFFNFVNGALLSTYLRSTTAYTFLSLDRFSRSTFWVGMALWASGFAGNILHDEILLNIRRNAKAKGKARANSPSPSCSPNKKRREHYGIPHGYLYTYVSYPNYFCEWVEWFGFALAVAPVPDMTSLSTVVASIQPPWVFFVAEVFLMIGRAYNGHRWYLGNFPDYPNDRRVVIPFIF